jgi:hypothetical protein
MANIGTARLRELPNLRLVNKAMAVEDEYRKHADKSRFLAECSPKRTDRAFWLLLAQNWQLLAQDMEAEPPDEQPGTEAKLASRIGLAFEAHR